jgi:hypothetical protein
MAVTIKHAKTDTIADWTQADLDAQIALGNFPPSTVLADIVLPSDWNNDHTISGTVPIANGGTGQTTANSAINALLPSQTSNAGKVLSTDGTNTSWIATSGTGTVTSVGFSAPSIFSVAGSPITSSGTIAMTYSGTALPVANGGTGQTSYTDGQLLIGNSTGNTLSKATLTAGSNITITNGAGNITIASTGGGGMTYPGAGIANSTGSAWGTSYTTTGSGTVVALATGASLTTPIQVSYETWTGITAPTYAEGRVWYDSTFHALAYYNDVSSAVVHIGQDLQVKVINNTGSTIANGSPVYITSTSSGQTYPNIALAKADAASTAAVIGLTNGSIANGAVGYVTSTGGIDGVNTGSYTVGQVLYLSPYSAGQLQNTVPPTGLIVQVGVVSYVDSSAGRIYVKQTQPLVLASTQGGTGLSSYTAGDTLYYSTGNTLTKLGIGTAGQVLTVNSGATAPQWSTPTTGTVTSVTGTAPISSSGGNTPAISISQATTSTNGYLSSTDWNTFNNKQTAYTNLTNIGLLANATGWLYNNGSGTFSYSTPTASDVGAVPTSRTISTTTPLSGGGALSSNLTLSMPAATTSVSGYLTSTDWNTFNNKGSGTVTSVSVVSANGLAGTVATATTTPAITLSTTVTGLLKGNGTAISAATSGTDYAPATSGSSILYGNGSGGFNNVTVGSGLSFAAGTLSSTATGTVTSVAALTLGTTGTDLSSTVANGTTTPVITLNVPTASASNRGALSSTDWTTFNNKAPGTTYTTNYIPYGQGTTTLNQSAGLQFDGTNFTTTGYATATSFIPSSSTIPTNGLYLPASNTIGFSTNTTERMRIDSSGIVTGTAGNLMLVSGSSQATTSGTSIPFTGIPSWVKKITVILNEVSTNSTNDIFVRVGTSGGAVSSGYVATGCRLSTTLTATSYTNGFGLLGSSSADIKSGIVTITNISGNIWIASGVFKRDTSSGLTIAGSVSLGSALTGVYLQTNGTDAFDAGSVNILYE